MRVYARPESQMGNVSSSLALKAFQCVKWLADYLSKPVKTADHGKTVRNSTQFVTWWIYIPLKSHPPWVGSKPYLYWLYFNCWRFQHGLGSLRTRQKSSSWMRETPTLQVDVLCDEKSHCTFHIITDNMAAVAQINKLGGVKSDEYHKVAYKIWSWCESRSVCLYLHIYQAKKTRLQTVCRGISQAIHSQKYNKCLPDSLPHGRGLVKPCQIITLHAWKEVYKRYFV